MSSEPFLGGPGPAIKDEDGNGVWLGWYFFLAFHVPPGYLVRPAYRVLEGGRDRGERGEEREGGDILCTCVRTTPPRAHPRT